MHIVSVNATVAAELVPLVVVGERAAFLPGSTSASAIAGLVGHVLARAAALEARAPPRWAVTSAAEGLGLLVDRGLPIGRCWDVAEAHRVLFGGWRADPAYAWVLLRGLDVGGMPAAAVGDLFDFAAAPGLPDRRLDNPVGPDGYLRPGAFEPGWAHTDKHLVALAGWVRDVAHDQVARLAATGPRAVATARSESAAAGLCLELEREGLPVDRAEAERLIAQAAGPRPTSPEDTERLRRERDEAVLRHAPGDGEWDLRNPAQVRALLSTVGIDVPSTRAHLLERYRDVHPLVDALLRWRKDERIATTYGYRWLDEHVGQDGRLRGAWTACDGAAGRMTAQNGLHNLPGPLRAAVRASPGHVFVRADLGQIEPRVLAVVSGDRELATATRADDLYAPVAAKLGVARPIAKVAVLAAMYGQRSGPAGRALADLERAYPIAMGSLDDAYAAGIARRPLRTYGGRLIRLDAVLDGDGAADPALGRYARNAIIQGSAAELFKAWAATVRHTVSPLGARVVLCLHDELLVHVPEARASPTAAAVVQALHDSARRWSGTDAVRFVADVSVIRSWAEAKG